MADFVEWPWPGGQCPVPTTQQVEVRYAAGSNTGAAGLFDWRHTARNWSVLRYRVLGDTDKKEM
ncbi:hypothetical protein ACOTF1_24720 [Achromobacter ruhlandii]|uniref:hypothetical protein n=1 Tax=Achromobacter ruhlandii TaxID=72557 RepID=UPI003B9BB25D